MQTYHTQTVIASNGSLNLGKLPFAEGEVVEVTIQLTNEKDKKAERKFPYREKRFELINPFDSA